MDRIFKAVPKRVRLKPETPFFEDDGFYQVWTFCGIKQNPKGVSRPGVVVGFRRRTDDGRVESDVHLRDVHLSDIGQVRIGTIWQGVHCKSEVRFEERSFTVNFDEGYWRFVSFARAHEKKLRGEPGCEPYPYDLYPTGYPRDLSPLIEFDLYDPEHPDRDDPEFRVTGKLVVPCIEFLSRMYGRSQHVTRTLILTSLHGQEGTLKRLIGDPPKLTALNSWWVTLKRKCYNDDGVFLAHLMHDQRTRAAVEQIQRQLDVDHVSWARSVPSQGMASNASGPGRRSGTPTTFLEVPPWHGGEATLLVRGMPFADGDSFYTNRVEGCSDPEGPPIDLHRETDGGTEPVEDLTEAERLRMARHDPVEKDDTEDVESSTDDEADYGGRSKAVGDDSFTTMKKPRTVQRRRAGSTEVGGSIPVKAEGEDPKRFANSDNHGQGKGTGYLSLAAKQDGDPADHPANEIASSGFALDMWHAFRRIAEKNPDVIESVGFYTFEKGAVVNAVPRFVKLKPFGPDDTILQNGKDESIRKDMRRWVFVGKSDVRGVLVILLRIKGKTICVVELQRKPPRLGDNGQWKEREEFRGLTFPVPPEFDMKDWLLAFLDDVRKVKGVVASLDGERSFPAGGYAFKHSSPRGSKDAAKPEEAEKSEDADRQKNAKKPKTVKKPESAFTCQFPAHHALECAGIKIQPEKPS